MQVLGNKKGIDVSQFAGVDFAAFKETQYDILAEELRKHLDMKKKYMRFWMRGLTCYKTDKDAPYCGAADGGSTMQLKRCAGRRRTMRIELENVKPMEIEKRSFEIIAEELGDTPLVPGTELVVKRCIHTSADFDYAQNLCFSERAVEHAIDAIRNGACIVTDTQMAKAGINKRALARYGGEVYCFMSDGDVAETARKTERPEQLPAWIRRRPWTES